MWNAASTGYHKRPMELKLGHEMAMAENHPTLLLAPRPRGTPSNFVTKLSRKRVTALTFNVIQGHKLLLQSKAHI